MERRDLPKLFTRRLRATMRVLISSHLFHPSIGGIEQVSALLADGFTARGHEVKLITQSAAVEPDSFPYEIIRQPGPRPLLAAVRWCHVFLHNNISLQTAWPLLFLKRPWVIAHQTWIATAHGRSSWQSVLKRFLLRFAANISVSREIAQDLKAASVVVGNPYRDDLFQAINHGVRTTELVYVGRLVSDKGVDVLLQAMSHLQSEGLMPRLTVIGSGPELSSLRALAGQLDVNKQVAFVGSQTGTKLAELLNQHKIMVVPSRWREPFGIVALEGMACGCAVVGSEGGGLKEAIGPCGQTFPNGDAASLAQVLGELLRKPEMLSHYHSQAQNHLRAYTRSEVVDKYLQLIEAAAVRLHC